MFGLRTLVPLLATTILLVAPAVATTSYYTGASGETSFNTAVAGLTLLDPALTFSGTPGSTGLLNASGTGVDFLGFDTAFSFNSPQSFTVNSGKLTGNQSEVVQINFPAAGVYAFGFHITVTSGSGTWCADVTKTGCAASVSNASPSDVKFIGFVSNIPVTVPLYLDWTTSSQTLVLTNFEAYGAGAPAVPESRTMLLVGLGLAILPLTRRKIRSPLQRIV
jgi:hypothetical protein